MKSTLMEKARAGENLGLDIIDMHGHWGNCSFFSLDTSAQSVIANMDALGISKFFISHHQTIGIHPEAGNDELFKAMKKYPERLYGYAIVYPGSREAVRKQIERCLKLGFSGIKLHDRNQIPYDDEAYTEAYKIAHDMRLPVLFHAGPAERYFTVIAKIAKNHPNACFIAAHAGFGGKGYDETIEFVNSAPNLYIDPTFSGATRGLIEYFVKNGAREKMVWGSDCYFFSQTQQIGKVLGADITDEEKIMLLSTNARQLLAKCSINMYK